MKILRIWLIVAVIVSLPLFAQDRPKKVEYSKPISPKTTSHTLEFVLNWAETGEAKGCRGSAGTIQTPCNFTAWQYADSRVGAGSISLFMEAQAGYYLFRFSIGRDSAVVTVAGSWQILFDGVVVMSQSFTRQGLEATEDLSYVGYHTPMLADFTAGLSDSVLCFGEISCIDLSPKIDCLVEPYSIPLHVSIRDSCSYLSLYNGGYKSGKSYDGYWGEQSLCVGLDSISFDSTGRDFTIDITWGTISKTISGTIGAVKPQIVLSAEDSNTVYAGNSKVINANLQFNARCWFTLPDTSTYIVEITSGHNLGFLTNTATGDTGQILYGLKHSAGSAVFNFTAYPTLDTTAYIRIKASTTYHDIRCDPFVILVSPHQLRVRFDPPYILTGDTANVIIQRRNSNGGWSDISAGQILEVGQISGCEYGAILADSVQSAYFDLASQPIKFVAAKRIGSDSGVVNIGVGLAASGNNKIRSQIEADGKNTKNSKIIIGGGNCCGRKFNNHDISTAQVVVKEKCGNYDEYNPAHYVLDYDVVVQNNPFIYKADESGLENEATICIADPFYYSYPDTVSVTVGQTQPLEYTFFIKKEDVGYARAWDIKPLYEWDSELGLEYLHFLIVDTLTKQVSQKLIFNVVSDLCYNNIAAQNARRSLINLTSLNDMASKIPASDKAIAMADFDADTLYPQVISRYRILEVIKAHENEHVNDYRKMVSDTISGIRENLKKLKLACATYNSSDEQNVKNYFLSEISDAIHGTIDKYFYDKINHDSVAVRKNEIRIQASASVKAVIHKYKDALSDLYPGILYRRRKR
jgi:hypothetical protein